MYIYDFFGLKIAVDVSFGPGWGAAPPTGISHVGLCRNNKEIIEEECALMKEQMKATRVLIPVQSLPKATSLFFLLGFEIQKNLHAFNKYIDRTMHNLCSQVIRPKFALYKTHCSILFDFDFIYLMNSGIIRRRQHTIPRRSVIPHDVSSWQLLRPSN